MKNLKRTLLSSILSIIAVLSLAMPDAYASKSISIPAKELAASSTFQIDFIDVGQGDAALVECDGHYMLVDGGGSKKSDLIYTYLKNRKITYLDYIVATHPDADHIGGLSAALNYAAVGTALSPVTTHTTKTFQSFLKYLQKQNKQITVPAAGDTFMLGSASVYVLGPVSASEESNNNSIVLRIVYGETSFLLTGDAEFDEEREIIDSKADLHSTLIKIAHHGSKYSTSYYWLREVAPEYAIISVGADNQYGHPTDDVLSRLRDADVKTFRTDINGDIICKSDGKTITVTPSKNAGTDTPLANNNTNKNASVQKSTETTPTAQTASYTYILNSNTHKFHYASCKSVKQMKDSNKITSNDSRDTIIAQGYSPCKNCNP